MLFWTAYDFVVPLLLEHAYGLSNAMRGFIMGLDNLLSLFMLPLFGKISDKANGKLVKNGDVARRLSSSARLLPSY